MFRQQSSQAKSSLIRVPFSAPFEQFEKWFEEAKLAKGEKWPNAMQLATCSRDAFPSVRTVLMQQAKRDTGIAFYTNYNSRKASELAENPRAAVVFYWTALERQVRLEGNVRKASKEESDEYFSSRPRNSQIASIVSKQSHVLENGHSQLVREFEEMKLTLLHPSAVTRTAATATIVTTETATTSMNDNNNKKSNSIENENNNITDVDVDVIIRRPEDGMGLFWIEPVRWEFWQEGQHRLHQRTVFELCRCENESSLSSSEQKDEETMKCWNQFSIYP